VSLCRRDSSSRRMSAKRKAAASAAALGADGTDPKRRKLPVSLLPEDDSGVVHSTLRGVWLWKRCRMRGWEKVSVFSRPRKRSCTLRTSIQQPLSQSLHCAKRSLCYNALCSLPPQQFLGWILTLFSIKDVAKETPEGTTTVGLAFVAQMKQSRDKK